MQNIVLNVVSFKEHFVEAADGQENRRKSASVISSKKPANSYYWKYS
jgi:hypothetical protein